MDTKDGAQEKTGEVIRQSDPAIKDMKDGAQEKTGEVIR
jgi:hypothetical protein